MLTEASKEPQMTKYGLSIVGGVLKNPHNCIIELAIF